MRTVYPVGQWKNIATEESQVLPIKTTERKKFHAAVNLTIEQTTALGKQPSEDGSLPPLLPASNY